MSSPALMGWKILSISTTPRYRERRLALSLNCSFLSNCAHYSYLHVYFWMAHILFQTTRHQSKGSQKYQDLRDQVLEMNAEPVSFSVLLYVHSRLIQHQIREVSFLSTLLSSVGLSRTLHLCLPFWYWNSCRIWVHNNKELILCNFTRC